jgi:predicted  nucleic acid-binding Zn-ribbon protein
MHPQLETLLEIQDLKSQKNDLLDQSEGQNVERDHFNVSIDEAVSQVEQKIGEMEGSLAPAVRNRYQRLAGRGKFIVPVINGTCFGCFVSIPTAVASVSDRNNALRHCDNCGRFLYIVG